MAQGKYVGRETAVNFPWVIRIGRENGAALARLRLLPGIEVGETADALWLRGKPADDSLDRELNLLPAEARYEHLPDQRLRLFSQYIPEERLPAIRWQPIGEWLKLEAPPAAMPSLSVETVPLRLVRSAEERGPEVLLTGLAEWTAFVSGAARIRLGHLHFAASSTGQVLVRGNPLPSVAGRRFVVNGGLAVPAGFTWQPAVSPEVALRLFNVAPDALVLWQEDGTITRLQAEQFVAATWSAVRATTEATTSPGP